MSRPLGRKDMHGHARRYDPKLDQPYQHAIAKRLQDARLERDVSLTELAAATGYDPSSIAKIERGENWPNTRTLCRLAVALGLSPSELMP
jgi:ribosome-binding protein aMBF1 (putative translation factor)